MEDLSVNQVIVDVSGVICDVSTNLIIGIIKAKLGEVKLDDHAVQVINLVLDKCPGVIDGLDKHIKTIISDNVINSGDIPAIILLMRDILNAHVQELNRARVTRDQVIGFIKNIFIVLIETDVIKTGSVESKQATLALVDLCVKLLESKVAVQKVVKCRFF